MTKKQKVSPERKGDDILLEMRKGVSSKQHIDQNAAATARAVRRVQDLADSGNEDIFVKQIKEAFPGISGNELLEKISLYRELKRLRSSRG